MIPFASQRASGQDLATHLLNEHDNDQMEVASVRGAIAQDLHGAFAEWEALAHNLTRCRKYLYSLSINPDPAQGALTREQYADYIDRVEDRLGLTDQPRAIVYHIKPDKSGEPREHCHVVWSRVDADNGKAVHIAFDREKLMKVTREFARDHDLHLPGGYHHKGDRDQLSLYEKTQQERTGLTKEQRIAEVTEAWCQCDNAKAFVQALKELGYILANGRRPYVLIDRYGEMNALPRLIDDQSIDNRKVRTKDIRSFLEKDFPPDSLPNIDEARALAAQHCKERADLDKSQQRNEHCDDRLTQLMAMHAERRQELEKESPALKVKHVAQEFKLAACQQDEIRALEIAFQDEMEKARCNREAHRSTGLAAFLGRVTGMTFLIRKLRQQKDRHRRRRYLRDRARLEYRYKQERMEQVVLQQLQRLNMVRRFRTLDQIERRELSSLDMELLREGRVHSRDGQAQTLEETQRRNPDDCCDTYIDLQDAFDRAAMDGENDDDDDGEGDSKSRSPKIKTALKRHTDGYNRRAMNNDTDRDR
jgi:hypothetical protein